MTTIEYTKSEGKLLLTSYSSSPSGTLRLRLLGITSGNLHLGNLILPIDGDFIEVSIAELSEGVLTPFLTEDGKSYVCDKIEIEAGVVTPSIPEWERILYLTKRMIAAESKAQRLEKTLLELCDAVYGKSIL